MAVSQEFYYLALCSAGDLLVAYRQAVLAALQADEDCRRWCALHPAHLLCLTGALSVTEYGTETLVCLALCCVKALSPIT